MRLAIFLIVLAIAPAVGCQSELKGRTESSLHMKALHRAILKHVDEKGSWPDALGEIEPFLGAADELGPVNDKKLDALMHNPLTGDRPGYEYVNPEGSSPSADGIILYQLRDGKRDETLLAVFRDGTIRKPGE